MVSRIDLRNYGLNFLVLEIRHICQMFYMQHLPM